MSIPGHSIVPLTADDILTTTSFLQDSKLQLAINRFLIKDWPNEAVQRPLYQAAIEGGLKNPNTTSLKVVNDKSGETVGYFFFTKRGQPAPDEDKASKSKIENAGQNVPPGLVPEVFHAVMKAVETLESDVQGEHLGKEALSQS
ncbi:hypothetical protein TruAng_004466 [Truncatella angustata]|nr:hypothetical protein TruAng_004466 [Truncatella angustata]